MCTFCSLAGLKRKLAEAKSRRASAASEADGGGGGGGITPGSGITPGVHIEADRFLTEEDFERIR